MAFTATALQLVNRVNERRRMPAVGAFTETEDFATLNAINHAIEEIMTEQRWDFNVRHDGQLTLRGKLDDITVTALAGSTTAVITRTSGLVNADVFGDYMVRMMPDGVSDYANTAFRVNFSSYVAGGTVATISLETAMPDAVTAAACELHYSEYILPDTVDVLIRATYEEEEITLTQQDPRIGFDELYPRKQIEFGSPEMISVGGFGVPTYASDDTSLPSLRLDVWPVPDDEYVINYSYHYRHPTLSTVTDTLDGVPPAQVSKIIDLAAADMKTYYDKDPMGLAIRRSVKASTQEIYDTHGGQRGARKPHRSWESSRRGSADPFRGKTLG